MWNKAHKQSTLVAKFTMSVVKSTVSNEKYASPSWSYHDNRTPCIHLSNSHCTVFKKACVPTRHQCEPLARCNQTHLAELWLCHGRRWRRCSCGFLTDMSPYLTKQEGIYSVILPIYNASYNRASVFSLQIFLSPLSPAPLEVLIAAYCCFAPPSMSTPAMSTPAFLTVPRCPLPRFQSLHHCRKPVSVFTRDSRMFRAS